MQIPKDQILELLRGRGDDDKAAQAESELPDEVDTDRDKDQLDRFGIDPQELMSKLSGKIPGL